jgi:protein O-GlcNAc transferase
VSSRDEAIARARGHIAANAFDEALALLGPLAESDFEAAMFAGVAANRGGDLEAALGYFSQAAALEPGLAAAHLNLALTFRALNRKAEATQALWLTLEIEPNSTAAHFALGNLQMHAGDFSDAAVHFSNVLESEPGHLGAMNNIAICLTRLGNPGEAASYLEETLALDRNAMSARVNLGAIRAEQGRTDEAIDHYQHVLQLDPAHSEAANNLGVALLDKGRAGEAAAVLRRLAESGHAGGETFSNLGNALTKLGDTEGASEAYRQAIALSAGLGVQVKHALLLPVICTSLEEMMRARQAYERRIDALIADPPVLADPFEEVGVPSFNLSYQDANNRTLMEKLSDMYRLACPGLDYVAPHCSYVSNVRRKGPVRIGFISRFFQSNSVGRCFEGVLRHAERDDVSVTAFTFSAQADPLWEAIERDVDRAIVLPTHLHAARERIAAAELDALVYTDIGMDPLTYYIAFSRLAPLQCALGGHPDATGLPTIDAYISCDLQEPPDAADHYRAPLVRLPGAPTYYERPELPTPLKPRSAFGLPETGALYFCGQTLIKLHPQMDDLLSGILERDRTGIIALPEGYTPELAALLMARFRRTIPEHIDRIRFLPAMSHMDYMNVMALADVSLDTRPFGGGNTSWQAIAAGTPMVTWPGNYLRGRYTQALYTLLGVDEAVCRSAEDYIERAVQFGTDPGFAADFNARVEARADHIFSDRTHVDALYEFIVRRVGLEP